MTGREYIALTRFSDKDNRTIVAVGQTCDALSSDALAWAIDRGFVRAVPSRPDPVVEAPAPAVAAEQAEPVPHADGEVA